MQVFSSFESNFPKSLDFEALGIPGAVGLPRRFCSVFLQNARCLYYFQEAKGK